MDKILCGVSQELTLGPLLFNIYINNLSFSIKSQIRLFANDTNITMSHIHADKLENMNTELINISNWMKLNKLSINYKILNSLLLPTKKQNQTAF